MFINLVADYGTGDPAFSEVAQRLQMLLPQSRINLLSVPPFSTLATGFWIAQLSLNPGPDDRVVYHSCAPRKDDLEARQNEVTQAHQEQVQQLISGLALRLRNDSEWEPSTGEHCKRCTYQKNCGAVCPEPEPLPEDGRKLKLVQLALAV